MPVRSLLLTVSACLTLALLPVACDNETDQNRAALPGYWQVQKAFRNQKETGTLAGVWFHFGADGKMETNLPIGMEGPADYSVNKNEIQQKGDHPVTYVIKNIDASSLTLLMEMRGLEFEFQLARTNGPVEPALPADESAPADSTAVPADSSGVSE